jgi:hypothetical protein
MKRMMMATLAVALVATTARAGAVAGEDFDGGAFNLISSTVPALDGGPGDWFGVGSRNGWPQGFPTPGVPFSLMDDSVADVSGGGAFAGDLEGIYGMNSDFDNNFFAMSDSDEFGSDQTASWTFDISGASNLGISIGFGGVSDESFGGYSGDTSIMFSAQVDGGTSQLLFDINPVTDSGFATRPMDGGAASGGGSVLQVTGDATVTKILADTGLAAGDTFVDKTPASGAGAGELDNFLTSIDGTGSELVVTLTANLPFEAFAFDNIVITPEPTTIGLLALGGAFGLLRRRR